MKRTPGAAGARTGRRLLGALLVTAVGVAVIPAMAPAGAQTEPPPPRGTGVFCAGVPDENPFPDVDDNNTFAAQIRCLAAAEITKGNAFGEYGPRIEVNREQMATFVARTIDKAKELDLDGTLQELAPYDGENRFTDTVGESPHTPHVNRLAAAGIVQGGPGGRPSTEYGPTLDVSRAQMASFINRSIAHLTGQKLTTTETYFTDLGGTSAEVQADINGIASEGIASGSGDGTYGPARSVNRDAMAAFLVRPLAFLEDVGAIAPLREAPEAEDGPINGSGGNTQSESNKGAEVRSTKKDANSFVACDITELAAHIDTIDDQRCFTYNYATGDTFLVDGDSTDLAGFVAQLSPYDDVTGTYSSGGASTFSLRNEAPLPPAGVTLEATSTSSVNVTIKASATPSVDAYEVRRGAPATLTGCGGATYTTIDTVKASSTGDTTYPDESVQPDSEYCYRVFSVDDGDVSSGSVTAGPVTTSSTSVEGAPFSVAIELVHGLPGASDKIDSGDTIRIAFNETMAAPASSAAIIANDDVNTETITCGSGNSCSRNSSEQAVAGTSYGPNRVISISIGSDTGLKPGALIDEQRGFNDTTGETWSIEDSTALNISVYTADGPLSVQVSQTNGPNGFASRLDVGDVIELVFDQEMKAPVSNDYIRVGDGTTGSNLICGSPPAAPQGNATCVRSGDDHKVILITVNSATFIVPLPTTIIDQGNQNPATSKGFQNLAGVAWDLENSPPEGKEIEQ